MKILFVPIMNPYILESSQALDYHSDTLVYGLRKSFGDDVVDIVRLWFMYKKDRMERPPENFEKLWGKAFTCYGLLEDDSQVDREDIASKLKNQFFDFNGKICNLSSKNPALILSYFNFIPNSHFDIF